MKLEHYPPNALTAHPLHERIYGKYNSTASNYTELRDSIKAYGILEPIVITPQYEIIGGRSRTHWAMMLGLSEVPCVLFESKDPLDIEAAIIESNRQRVKTNAILAREAKHLMGIEKERAKRRLEAAGKKSAPGKKALKHVTDLSSENGNARDAVGQQLGVSGPTAERLADIGAALEDAESAGDLDRADTIEQAVNTSVAAGMRAIKAKAAPVTPEPEEEDDPHAPYYTKRKAEWDALSEGLKDDLKPIIDMIGDNFRAGHYLHSWLHAKRW